MFTGIITDIGKVTEIEERGDTRFRISTVYDADGIDLGASIACSGACLTVIEKGRADDTTCWFDVEASGETLNLTKLGSWKVGTRMNLERALKAGDELGGHIVSGHVDGVGSLVSSTPEGDSWRLTFKAPAELMPYVASKGSITIDGISLTVNEVGQETFGVNIIPHTQTQTTLGDLNDGDPVNLEIDMLARYVARQIEFAASAQPGQKSA